MDHSIENTFDTALLQQLSLCTGNHPVEQADWVEVNEKLRKRGLLPIILSHPDISTKDGLTVFSEEAGDNLRRTLLHLMQENEKKQETISELHAKDKNKTNRSVGNSPMVHHLKKKRKEKNEEAKNKWDISFQSSFSGKKADARTQELLRQKYDERIKLMQSELDELKKSMEGFQLQRPTKISQPTKSLDLENSPKGTHRSKKSEVTAATLESLLDDIYLNDTPAAKKYRKKCAALKSKIHILKSENSQLQAKIENLKETEDFPTYRVSSRCRNCTSGSRHRDHKKQNNSSEDSVKFLEKLYKIVLTDSEDNEVCYTDTSDCRMELLKNVMLWKSELNQLKDVSESLKRLRQELAPLLGIQGKQTTASATTDFVGTTVKSVLDLIEEMQKDLRKGCLGSGNRSVDRRNFSSESHIGENLSFEEMRTTIHHFMKLFDVEKENAVYTRIYDLYVRYFEMLNAFHSLRQILHLKKENTVSDVINLVGKLSSKWKRDRRADKIDRVMLQVEEYDKFYSAFYELVKNLKDLLVVDEIDDILPAVKRLASS